jgi:acyl-CoA oxidase
VDETREELLGVVYDGMFHTVHEPVRTVLLDRIFDPRPDLTERQACRLAFGNNAVALETEAVHDSATGDFVLNTPSPRARKFMPNATPLDGLPKIGVVLARLKMSGVDHGVFPFVVRLSDHEGPLRGVHVTALPGKPGLVLDNAITSFDHVRVPRRNVLNAHVSGRAYGRRARFLRFVDALATGRIGLTASVLACARASLYIAIRYSHQRLTFAPGQADVPIITYRSQQRALFQGLAGVYAMTCLLNGVKRRFARDQENGDRVDLSDLIAVAKAVASWTATEVIHVCRERCGAQGMFSANRIADYVAVAQGVVAAEGDNLVILSTAAANLLGRPPNGREPVESPAPAGRDLRDPEFLTHLLDCRVDVACRRHGRELGRRIAHGDSRFRADIGMAAGSGARQALGLLATLYGLGEGAKRSGWLLAEGALTATQVTRLPELFDEVCAELAPHACLLADGFGITNDVLRSAIADDYLGYYNVPTAEVT